MNSYQKLKKKKDDEIRRLRLELSEMQDEFFGFIQLDPKSDRYREIRHEVIMRQPFKFTKNWVTDLLKLIE